MLTELHGNYYENRSVAKQARNVGVVSDFLCGWYLQLHFIAIHLSENRNSGSQCLWVFFSHPIFVSQLFTWKCEQNANLSFWIIFCQFGSWIKIFVYIEEADGGLCWHTPFKSSKLCLHQPKWTLDVGTLLSKNWVWYLFIQLQSGFCLN